MNDHIERQAAIDAFLRATADGDKFEWCESVLKSVPSVELEIIRCKDCINWQTEWVLKGEPGIHFCDMVEGFPDGDWYCAYGEKRINN